MAITIRQTANGFFRVQHYRTKRKALVSEKTVPNENEPLKTRDYVAESLSRAKRTIIDYADNNEFNYFVTITFDQKKIDRTNGELLYNQIKKAFKYYKKVYCPTLKYLLVPEMHQDGNFHFHGLVKIDYVLDDNGNAVPPTDLTRHYDKFKHCHYWRSRYFFDHFGAVRFDKIFANSIACSRYISKYITKETEKAFPLTYLCSRGLKKSQILWHDEFDSDLLDVLLAYQADNQVQELEAAGVLKPPFKNDFVTSYEFDGETAFQFFVEKLLQFGWHCDKMPIVKGSSLAYQYSIVSPDGACYI